MSVPEFKLKEDVNVIFLIDADEKGLYKAKIIKVNEDKTYDVLINNFVNKNSIYNDVIANKDINDKFTEYSYKNDKQTLVIQNIQPFIQSTTGGASVTKKLLINITKLEENPLDKEIKSNATSNIQPPVLPSNQVPPITSDQYNDIKNTMKEIITHKIHPDQYEELRKLAKDDITKNVPLIAELTNDIKNKSSGTIFNRILSANPFKNPISKSVADSPSKPGMFSGIRDKIGSLSKRLTGKKNPTDQTISRIGEGGKKRRRNKTVKRTKTRR